MHLALSYCHSSVPRLARGQVAVEIQREVHTEQICNMNEYVLRNELDLRGTLLTMTRLAMLKAWALEVLSVWSIRLAMIQVENQSSRKSPQGCV